MMKEADGLKLARGRPRKLDSILRITRHIQSQKSSRSSSLPEETLQKHMICRLKTPNFKDELAHILGNDEEPYFGLLRANKLEANTKNTTPTAEDRAFCLQLSLPTHVSANSKPEAGYLNEAEKQTKIPKLTIHFGRGFTLDAWYRSAYPAEYTRRGYLAVCCYCLDYTASDLSAERHFLKCNRRVPPGREIYRDGEYSLWEVDGLSASLYCQNLCLLAKSFLSSKSLYREVQPFFFYILTKTDDMGAQFIGYFSKQKIYSTRNPAAPIQSISCIMSLPFTQGKGYGQFLIDFSYLLARQQNTTGSPETPLSDLGEEAFRKFWIRKICYTVKDLVDAKQEFSIETLASKTGIHLNHVVLALEDLGWLIAGELKSTMPILKVNIPQMMAFINNWEKQNPMVLKPELLVWTPLYE